MPEASLWTFVASLALLSFGLTLRVAHLAHSLKLAQEEMTALIKKLDALKEQHQKEIAGIEERHKAQVAKFFESYERGIERAIDVTLDKVVKRGGSLGRPP